MANSTQQLIFDVDFARKQFPFFDLDASDEWAFFDNAGGTFPCWPVVDKLEHFYTYNKVQPYGDNALAQAAGEQMDEGRKVISDLLGVSPWSQLDAAGPDHAGIAALAGLGDYFETLYDHHFEKSDLTLNIKALMVSNLMNSHETALCKLLLEKLTHLPTRIFGKDTIQGREANVALISENHTSARLSTLMGKKGIATKHGHFYAYRILKKMGLNPDDGVLRLSFAHYNTMNETTRLIDALTDIL